MEIYAFGSIVRGDIDIFSDIDLLIVKQKDEKLTGIDKEKFSIYTYKRIEDLWQEGNPFAWHLYIESKCVFSSNKIPFLHTLGEPSCYQNLENDLYKFYNLFLTSKKSLLDNNYSTDFDLSMIFLSIRNFASCFSLGYLNRNEFSRNSAIKIGDYSISINSSVYNKLKEARLLATRGIGETISGDDLNQVIIEIPEIEKWFNKLFKLIK